MSRPRATTPECGDRLADFDGYIPHRSGLGIYYTVESCAELLTRCEPRLVDWTGLGRRGSTERTCPGELTEHGLRMRLLDRQRERREELAAGVRRK